ncbi:MAG: S8 family serine peptidase [Clostridia bacterium]|nr:S8 family serine peptidase [Clostridia bacterium]
MKKLLFLTLFILCLLSVPICAEEYIFTTEGDFPMPYSSSIEVVNATHNVYTTDNIEAIQPLIDEGLVNYCEPMTYSELFDYTLNDPHYPEQPNLTQISAQFAWNKGVFGDEVKVAVIDSGIYKAASDFTFSNVIKAKDYTATSESTLNYCTDEIGHGSMVAGIIAAAHNNTRGIAGIAPNVKLYIFKCFYIDEKGAQKGKNSDIIAAMYEAIDTYGVDIINFSGGSTSPTVFKEVTDYAAEKGVLMVSAVGNSGAQSGNTRYYPASYPNAIGVGSIDSNGRRASHSQRNDYVDIMAPGEDIYSVRLGGYEKSSGTSFASPHVAAALALAKSANPHLTAEELTEALYKTCNPMEDRYSGHGSLNVHALLACLHSMENKGSFVYSPTESSGCAYLIPPEGYNVYFAKYEDSVLTDIKMGGLNTSARDFNKYVFYIWKKDTLEPYAGDIPIIHY